MKDVYQLVTDKILAALDAGIVPWVKPWNAETGAPRNLKTGKTYRGVNVLVLAIESMIHGYGSPYWLTFKQAKALGGKIRKGEKATPVVFWKWVDKKEDGEVVDRYGLLRYYNVFNADQIDGLELPTAEPARTHDPVEAAEAIVAAMQNHPTIRHGSHRAAYSPTHDVVEMPNAEDFNNGAAYYSTLFHELTHSTGHESRVDRKIANGFGGDAYAREELVAEMGAAFLNAITGIEDNDQTKQSAAYLEHWRAKISSDKKLVVVAAGQAQKAVDYIRGVTFETPVAQEVK